MRNFYERKNEEDIERLQGLIKDVIRIGYYGYRQSFVENIIYSFQNFENYSELKEIEKKLFKEVGKKRENHESFMLELKEGGKFYIMINDSFMVVGLSLNEKSW